MLERGETVSKHWCSKEQLQSVGIELYKYQECCFLIAAWILSRHHCEHLLRPFYVWFGVKRQGDNTLKIWFSLQSHGNVCLGILNGADAHLGSLNIIGGKKYRGCVFFFFLISNIEAVLAHGFAEDLPWERIMKEINPVSSLNHLLIFSFTRSLPFMNSSTNIR